MKSWKEWQNEKPVTADPQDPSKRWKATKAQVMDFWQKVRPDIPLMMSPIPYEHKGSTYKEDGIRITGSKDFIASTLARLKEFMAYENPQTKLMLVYRETEKSDSPSEQSTYVFYLQTKARGNKNSQGDIAPTSLT